MPPTNKVWLTPVPSVKPKVWEYDEEQNEKIAQLKEYAATLLLPKEDPYYANEEKWLADPGCIPRYMRASKWRLDEAKRRIQGTLEWRREYKPDMIPPEEVKIEAETGKIILNGFDLDGRPILYLRPGRENTKESPRQIRHLVFCIERAIDLMPPGQESMACLVDYNSTTLRTSPSISNARKFLTIVQQHYVERLGRAIVVNLPMLLNFFFKGISPFLDPVTRDKIRFNPQLLDLFPAEQLDAQLDGGEFEYEFEHESYWRQICDGAGVRPDGTRFEPVRAAGTIAATGEEQGSKVGEAKEIPSLVNDSSKSEQTAPSSESDAAKTEAKVVVSSIPAPSEPPATESFATPQAPSDPASNAGTNPQTNGAEPAFRPVDASKLQAMRQNVIAKYEQTQANLEKNQAGAGTHLGATPVESPSSSTSQHDSDAVPDNQPIVTP